MRAALIFLCFAALASATDVLLNYPLANLTDNGHVICATSLYGQSGPSRSRIEACGGTLTYIGCRSPSAPNAVVLAAANKTDVFNAAPGGVLAATGSARFFHFDTATGRMGFVNDSEPVPADCISAGSPTSMCWNINGTRPVAGGTCGNVYTAINTIERVYLTWPCEGKSPGDPCTTERGLCATGGTCSANLTCVGAVDVAPPPHTQCQSEPVCDPATGLFTTANLTAGTLCNASNVCTDFDQCDGSGQCVEGDEIICPLAPECQVLVNCTNPVGCVYVNEPDGTLCDDGAAATSPDTCQSGVCVPGPIEPCPIGPDCTGPGVRSNVTGFCEYPPLVDGTPCNSTDVCAQTAQCQTGQCVVTSNITCASSNPCLIPGACIPFTGCPFTPVATGTPCDDGNPCTNGTTCSSLQQCTGGTTSVSCPAPSQCLFNAVPQNVSGVCECPLTYPPRADGTPCDDGDLCTDDDSCIGGGCAGGTAVTCPGDQCNFATTCNPLTRCYNPRPDGTPCVLSNPCLLSPSCDDGECVGTLDTSNPFCNGASALGWIMDIFF